MSNREKYKVGAAPGLVLAQHQLYIPETGGVSETAPSAGKSWKKEKELFLASRI